MSPMKRPHLMVFDVAAGGHHGMFVQHLVEAWLVREKERLLVLVVPPHFLDIHRELADVISLAPAHLVRVETIDGSIPSPGNSATDLIRYDLAQGAVFRHYVDRLHPEWCLLMQFDYLQLHLILGRSPIHRPRIAGIYFRPSFHYAALTGRRPSWRERLNDTRKRLTLKRALQNPMLDTLFSLDPFVVAEIDSWKTGAKVIALPDGFSHPVLATKDLTNSVEPGRLIALTYGSLAERKGIFSIIDALPHLPEALQRRLALVFAGRVHEPDRPDFLKAIAHAKRTTHVQIVLDDRFLPEPELATWIDAATMLLVAYRRHIGSSNVLIRAAAAGKPVVGTDYGLVGEQIRRHRLGLAVDSNDPATLAAALADMMDAPDRHIEPAEAVRFAAANTATAFAETILNRLT
jgi:glycosyltransferase involved in cell wall biosynthesis